MFQEIKNKFLFAVTLNNFIFAVALAIKVSQAGGFTIFWWLLPVWLGGWAMYLWRKI